MFCAGQQEKAGRSRMMDIGSHGIAYDRSEAIYGAGGDGVLRIGVIGLGIMGSEHATYLAAHAVNGAELTAVADLDRGRLAWAERQWGDAVARFCDANELIASGRCDGVLIATPHFLHPSVSREALAHGLHVLCEKPIAVYTASARDLAGLAAERGLVFGVMYNQRTNPVYQQVRNLVISGELGEIKRTSWTVTHWYRSQSYYEMGNWRATWSGEGGGVLLNQCPHQLDLWQWVLNMMPVRIQAFMGFGKYHDIEVEDDVTAYVEYANGATGTFITSTGEAPGTNRLEIAADRGKLVVENDREIRFWRLVTSEREFNRTYRGGHGAPEVWQVLMPLRGHETGYRGITQNWVDAIVRNEPLLAPGEDGLQGLTLSNAMHLSAWTGRPVDLPLDEAEFERLLRERMKTSAGPVWNG